MKEYRDFIAAMHRRAEADDALAIGLARDFITFGRWLNATGIAASPVVVHVLKLEGTEAARALAWPLVLFALGLCCSALATLFAFLALAKRGDRSVSQANEVEHRMRVYEAQLDRGELDPEWRKGMEAKIATLAEEGRTFDNWFVWHRFWVILFAAASVFFFGAGVFRGGYGFLQ